MDVPLGVAVAIISKKGGGLGEGGLQIAPDTRLADDGKRFQAMDVVFGLLLAEKFFCVTIGEGFWEGSEKNAAERRLADVP